MAKTRRFGGKTYERVGSYSRKTRQSASKRFTAGRQKTATEAAQALRMTGVNVRVIREWWRPKPGIQIPRYSLYSRRKK